MNHTPCALSPLHTQLQLVIDLENYDFSLKVNFLEIRQSLNIPSPVNEILVT